LVREFGFKRTVGSNGNGKVAADQGERHAGDEPYADAELLERALSVIPNNLGWDEWNNVGMAIWPATNGAGAGFAIFDAWSRKSEKHDAKNTAAKWAAYHRSPPSCIGAGTIFYLANEAKPGWRTDSPKDIPERYAPSISPDQDQRNTYESPGDVDAQPVDLWAELAMPSLPEGALPERIEKLARHQSQLMGVDPGGIAAAALTVCAAAIPDRIQVRVKA
jgi:Primase C terminal 2 (PriCT-2)